MNDADNEPTSHRLIVFRDSGPLLENWYSENVVLGDFDNDGDLDLVLTSISVPNRIWLNDSYGSFHQTGQKLELGTKSVGFADFDGDGDLDAFCANTFNQPNRVWLNDLPRKSANVTH